MSKLAPPIRGRTKAKGLQKAQTSWYLWGSSMQSKRRDEKVLRIQRIFYFFENKKMLTQHRL